MDAGPVLLRKGVFLTGGRTRGRKAIGGVVGRSNPTQSLGTKIAAANFKLKSAAQFGKLRLSSEKHFPDCRYLIADHLIADLMSMRHSRREAEVHDVAVLHDIILAFEPQLAGIARAGFAAAAPHNRRRRWSRRG